MQYKLLLMLGCALIGSSCFAKAMDTNTELSSRTRLHDFILRREGGNGAPSVAAVNPSLHKAPSPFFNTHSIVFFFASTCPHCHKEAPILRRWAESAGARILALSFDGKPLPDFKNAQIADKALVNAAYQGQEIRYPGLFVMNEESLVLYPAAIGSLSARELSQRMDVLIPKIIRFEKGASA